MLLNDAMVSIALDPVIRKDGTLLYYEALCRPKGCGLDYSVAKWIQEIKNAGRSEQLDLIMSRKVAEACLDIGQRIAINITPETTILYGRDILDILSCFGGRVIVEIVEWGDRQNYYDPRFAGFVARVREAGLTIMLDDIGTGAFDDMDLVKSLQADGVKVHFDHLEFALSAMAEGQDLVAEFVTNEVDFHHSLHLGATACQGSYARDFHARRVAGMLEDSGIRFS